MVELVDVQLRFTHHRMQTSRLSDQAIKKGPSHQFTQVFVVLKIRLTNQALRLQRLLVEIPTGLIGASSTNLNKT
ncbi:Uncharacterised protein [Vibrio cholerae]|uniref:Uncharacterized protein n=1 Tax=Vibrio cholerae TaxID=666 RepID=A0A655YVP7_VIBCL|nr:Uncharacterised protein [Vibrio cholerae]